ncbi:helix-turn-helix domain-containing protein [Cohnella zeiphila]|uniref:Crp/Fnr family transcriptional regulator n=1 Tax=Cohnella zeiphila TaxID=2761120 RepID=A0A7X0SKM9_9BACL|nr:Crp/Fnr family transcriptional regulator [Cohnella zeiphila]
MEIKAERTRLLQRFPSLAGLSDDQWEQAHPFVRTFPAKSRLFQKEEGERYGLFLLSGSVRITRIGEDGGESMLQLLSAGQVCSLLVLSGLSGRDYPGEMVAETEAEAMFVAKESFLRWVKELEPFRRWFFGDLLDNILQLGERMDARPSEPLDRRLAAALLRGTSEREPVLHATHQELAAEIGSAREVVTRALQRFREAGWLETGRGWLQVVRRDELSSLLGDEVTEKRKDSR